MSSLDDHRFMFERAGVAAFLLEDENAFRATCPICQDRLTVRDDGGIAYDCPGGCDRSAVIDQLTPREDTFRDAPQSWQPVPLLLHFAGGIAPERPTMLRRADGVALLYLGRLHAVSAEPEAGKGWLALAACREVMEGHQVAYVDYEDTEASIASRLRALDTNFEHVRDRFHYYRPDEPISDTAVTALLAFNPALVVIDGVTEALAIEGLDLASNQDVAEFYKRLARPFARAGAAVLLIDHVVKAREERGRYALGAGHKLAGVDVAYRLDVAQPFGRGREGLVKVTVTKDRPGYVREHASDRERIALMRLTSTDGLVGVELEAPDAAGAVFRPTILMERISRAVQQSPGLTIRGLREAVKGNNEAKSLGLELLVAEGYIDARREGQAVKHYPLREYRESTDVPTVPNRAQSVPRAHVPTVPPPLQGGTGQGTVHGHATVPNLATPEEEARIARLQDAA